MLAAQSGFCDLLEGTHIPYEAHEEPAGHIVRPDMMIRDIDGIIDRPPLTGQRRVGPYERASCGDERVVHGSERQMCSVTGRHWG
ncbi:hypothetical protein AB0I22_35645 [Streptomyces sp. NPDC050610]|uniref:hypothetical protein n=1 Tax=Streptomyces sp. NPDC050610 TaxID=3157097 RepID=UPI003424D6B9